LKNERSFKDCLEIAKMVTDTPILLTVGFREGTFKAWEFVHAEDGDEKFTVRVSRSIPGLLWLSHRIPIRPVLWGKDHWSTLAYIETLCVDGMTGSPARNRMRCDLDIHPGLASTAAMNEPDKRYPTRLVAELSLFGHDDWSCAEDAEAAGVIDIDGTGINPHYTMTEAGCEVVARLRKHKADGGVFANFKLEVSECQ